MLAELAAMLVDSPVDDGLGERCPPDSPNEVVDPRTSCALVGVGHKRHERHERLRRRFFR
jgi:hypothetical protein